jgi:hypothetical protein
MTYATSIIFDLIGQTFDTSSTVHFRSPSENTPDRFNPAFSDNANHNGSLPMQLAVVCDLHLNADHEGPSLINIVVAKLSLSVWIR